ncbi:hypothetical protein [[Actinomadura] parvosata]|uniref:hypothetical protein n=1 Tax=[Actinomadura] parvosata TaxID=1955412 RepID=UPI0016492E8E
MRHQLPSGWTPARIAEVASTRSAELLPLDTPVFMDLHTGGRERIRPSLIIKLGEICLARDAEDGAYAMGQLDGHGALRCWGYYGDDLAEALRAL